MMGLTLLTERHARQIAGVLSCYDRSSGRQAAGSLPLELGVQPRVGVVRACPDGITHRSGILYRTPPNPA